MGEIIARATRWQLVPLGDSALLVRGYGAAADRPVLLAVANALEQGPAVVGVLGCTLGIDTLLVRYDPLRVEVAALRRRLRSLLRRCAAAPALVARVVEVPVRYGGDYGPDMRDVARAAGLSVPQTIALHCGGDYRVLMIGFAPGFPYIGGLPAPLRLPRRAVPRTRVLAGSVAIAEDMVGVYPQDSPGGWHLIGRTDLRLFDPLADHPALLRPGDRVRFIPV
ncbi:MAG: 5-oxoprolinase subunit PxpB [Chloroflexales bacterium]|nr:5-oxoprolinase subunit PxpB [Chloroflexales bacterium]